MVSEIFDDAAWRAVDGFSFTDITYHRAVGGGTVRVAFNRPEVRNAFRPHTVDELYQALDHARQSPDVGCVLLTGNGPSPRDGGWAFCSGGDQRIRGRDGYQYASGEGADTVDPARTGRLHILEVQRLIRFMPKVVICVAIRTERSGALEGEDVDQIADASREVALEAFAEIRCRMILEGCKWDPQVGDMATLAPFPLVLPPGVARTLGGLAERLTAEALDAERALLDRPECLKRLGMPRAVRGA